MYPREGKASTIGLHSRFIIPRIQFSSVEKLADLSLCVFIGECDGYHLSDLEYLTQRIPGIKIKTVLTPGGHGGMSANIYQNSLINYLEKCIDSDCLDDLPIKDFLIV